MYSICWKWKSIRIISLGEKIKKGIDKQRKSMHNGETINARSGELILLFSLRQELNFRNAVSVSRIG